MTKRFCGAFFRMALAKSSFKASPQNKMVLAEDGMIAQQRSKEGGDVIDEGHHMPQGTERQAKERIDHDQASAVSECGENLKHGEIEIEARRK